MDPARRAEQDLFAVHCEVAMAAFFLWIISVHSVLAARAAGAGDFPFVWLLLLHPALWNSLRRFWTAERVVHAAVRSASPGHLKSTKSF